MKIAVASMDENITEHFGHCSNFNIFTVENNSIVQAESIPNPGHKPGFLPNFLCDQGVTVIIAGGIGGGAYQIFKERGAEVISGASGNAKSAVEAYLNGTLKSTDSLCHKHEHQGECGGTCEE